MPLPAIITRRLRLRPLASSDATAVIAYRNHPAVTRFQVWQPQTPDEITKLAQQQANASFPGNGEWLTLAIEEHGSERVVGDLAMRRSGSGPPQVELGITLAPQAQGAGLATEALTALLHHLFTQTAAHRVFASLDPENVASCRLFEDRLGFRREAHHIESLWWREHWVDDVIVALLRREWMQRPKDS